MQLKSIINWKKIWPWIITTPLTLTPFLIVSTACHNHPDFSNSRLMNVEMVANFSRPENVFIISKILDNKKFNTEQMQKYRLNIFKQLNISEAEWNDNALPKTISLKNQLTHLENTLSKVKADPKKETKFAEFATKKDEFKTIEDLDQEINATIRFNNNYQFKFKHLIPDTAQNQVNILLFELEVLTFYNFMINSQIISKENLLKLVFNINTIKDQQNGTELGITKFSSDTRSLRLGIYLKDDWFDNKNAKIGFDAGYKATKHQFSTFFHEFGHALHVFDSMTPNLILNDFEVDATKSIIHQKDQLKTLASKNDIMDGLSIMHKNMINNLDDYLLKILLKTHPQGFDNNEQKNQMLTLVKLLMVPSGYGHTATPISYYDDNNKVRKVDASLEWIAEGFAYYYLTPPLERTKVWEIWHDFFTKDFNRK